MKNVIFAGVGGQGVILATKVLMETAMRAGYDVKESEIHGMAQRGGSVDCHIRYGEKVYSPLIPKGKADYIVALEKLEALRKLEYLSPEGMLIVNDLEIEPAPVKNGTMKYPSGIVEWIRDNIKNELVVSTKELLKEAGSRKTLNIVMLGVLSQYLEFSLSDWEEALRSVVKEKHLEMNLKAFELGRKLQ